MAARTIIVTINVDDGEEISVVEVPGAIPLGDIIHHQSYTYANVYDTDEDSLEEALDILQQVFHIDLKNGVFKA